MKNVDKFKRIIKKLVTEQINTDRGLVKELDDLDSSLKKLDKNYRALINNSFSRVVLDDGQNGKKFDIQLYPTGLCPKEGTYIYDMRGYFNDSDRVYKKGLHLDDIKDFINNDLSELLGTENSYQRKALEKGKKPYWDKKDHEHKDNAELKEPESDQMEEVKDKDIKKQIGYSPEDMAERKLKEMGLSLGLDELAEKIENSVWGAIKREGESTHQKTAKADHDVKDPTVKKHGHVLTKTKRRKAKTKKVQEKSKGAEHSENITVTPSKVGTPKVKDFKDDKRKAVNESKKKSLSEIMDLSNALSYTDVAQAFVNVLSQLNKVAEQNTGKSLFDSENFGLDYRGEEENVSAIIFPNIDILFDLRIEPTEENVRKVKQFLLVKFETPEVYINDNSDGKWIAIKDELDDMEVGRGEIYKYLEYVVQWARHWIVAVKFLTSLNATNISEGLWDRMKSGVKGSMVGAGEYLKHNIDKFEADGNVIRDKAFGRKDDLKKHRVQQKAIRDKERYHVRKKKTNDKDGGGGDNKRSIYKTSKDNVVASNLFSAYSKKLGKRFESFEQDLSKSFGVDESDIISTFRDLGLDREAETFEILRVGLDNFSKVTKRIVGKLKDKKGTKSNIEEGMWNRGVAKVKGLTHGASTMRNNLRGRDADVQNPRQQAKIKQASVLFDGFYRDMSKLIKGLDRDMEILKVQNGRMRAIPKRLQSIIDSFNL